MWFRRYLAAIAVSLALFSPALAADSTVPAMTAGGAIADTDLFYCVQSAGTTDRKCTPVQLATYIFGKVSGDLTCTSGGACTLKNTGPGATGPLGSATVAAIVTIDAQGRVTALSSATITPAVGSITGLGTGVATALAANANGAGGFITVGNAITSVTPGGGLVSGITASCTQTAITTSGTLSGAMCVNAQVGTTYTVADTDRAKLVTFSNGSAIAVTLPQAGTGSAFANGWFVDFVNKGAGSATVTPATSTINGAATLVLATNQSARVYSDGTNYQVFAGSSSGSGTGANPTATAGPTAVNGVATTFLRSDGAPAVQKGSNAQFGIVEGDGTTITCVVGVCSTTALTVTTSVQSGTNYAFLAGDQAKVVYLNNASAQTPTVAQAGTTGFAAGYFVTACNIGAGIQTLTPATSTIGGASTLAIPGGSAASPRCYTFISDGTNYLLVPSGNAFTIASGTSALGTSAIGSAACATVVTTSAPGVVTTDVPIASFNGDPTAVTGYVPLTAGMLTIIGYPTANNVNWKVCNNTSSSITPGAITLNWRVAR